MATAKRSPILYILLVAAAIGLALQLSGCFMPGWVVIRYAKGGQEETPIDYVVEEADIDDIQEEPKPVAKRSADREDSSSESDEDDDHKEFDFDQDHDVIQMGLWFARTCSHKKNGFAEDGGRWKRKKRCHDKCSSVSLEKAMDMVMERDGQGQFLPMKDNKHHAWKHELSRFVWTLRIEMLFALTFSLVGLCLVVVIFRKVNNCRCLVVLAMIAFMTAGFSVFLPVVKLGAMHCQLRHKIKDLDMGDSVNAAFPYALAVSGIGALLNIAACFLLFPLLCKMSKGKNCGASKHGWKIFSNEKAPPTPEKGPVPVFTYQTEADTLPEKVPITDFVEAEKPALA